MLFHYTTQAGLLGILSSRSLWATDVGFLNDANELELVKPQLREALDALAETLDGADDPTDEAFAWSPAAVARATVQLIDQPDARRRERPWLGAYVACFCDDGDLLSQWRGYGKNGGYSLGFDADVLSASRMSVPSDPEPRLLQVQYGDGAVAAVVDEFTQAWATWESGAGVDMGYVRYAELVLPALASVKNPAFREEREWRLVVTTDAANAQLRTGELSLTPYIALPISTGALRQIVVGPGEHLELRLEGVRRLLATVDAFDDVRVVASRAPYRG